MWDMSHIDERLRRIYQTTDQKDKTLPVAAEISQQRASEILEMQEMSCVAAGLIREEVEATLVKLCGENKIRVKMAHFEESWERAVTEFYEEYDAKLIEAMLEMANEGELVGNQGFINRRGLRKRLKEIRKRDKKSQ